MLGKGLGEGEGEKGGGGKRMKEFFLFPSLTTKLSMVWDWVDLWLAPGIRERGGIRLHRRGPSSLSRSKLLP